MLVKLKMKPIYKSFLTVIALMLIVMVSIGIIYLLYFNNFIKTSDVDVSDYLSVNYMNGKSFAIDKEKNFSFTITSGNDEISYFNISLLGLNGEGKYTLLDEKNKEISSGKLKYGDNVIADNLEIESDSTKTYTLRIKNNNKDKALKGTIDISTVESVVVTFADTILKNNKVIDTPLTSPGKGVAITNEGLIKESDDLGTSYYFRGAVTNNYFQIGDTMWRIVRINGDGTVRLVLNGIADNVSSMYVSGATSFEYKNSEISKYLKNWIQDNLMDYESYLANSKYCNDITHDEHFTFQGYTRLQINQIPTFICLGESYSSNIGLLTADEVILAGGMINTANNAYYLYNANITDKYYTLTGSGGANNKLELYMGEINGSISAANDGVLFRSVRPVINLIKNVEVTGIGSEVDPYKIVEK